VVLLGTILQFTAFALIFINLPNDAPTLGLDNVEEPIIEPNVGVALTSSFLLGFGDACYNTQNMSLLGDWLK
jgi:hypothetical protein